MPASFHLLRRRFDIRGMVQGVGFRPFVFRLANAHALTGKVWNNTHGVTIECQGQPQALNRFAQALRAELPPLARIDDCRQSDVPPLPGETQFDILHSQRPDHLNGSAVPDAAVTIDSAVCNDCLREMRDPADRRHGHALINCTNCGPRFSILREIPYDRQNTTMGAFPMCPQCAAEYRDPLNRRFHAQPVCCPHCGPQLQLVTVSKDRTPAVEPLPGKPIEAAARLLLAGKILAIKGIGGFHLAVRADSDKAVARLRTLKKRDAKPFALMAHNLAAIETLVTLSPAAAIELASPAAPILLAPRAPGARVADAVAPGTHLLGVMLPYTPIHHLLFDAFATLAPASIPPLVMTSGNISSEPLVIDNTEALERLEPLCDAFLLHDRPIERPVDDSVLLDLGNRASFNLGAAAWPAIVPIRRSRGYVPAATPLPEALASRSHPTGICLGGELKNTIAVVRQRDIIVSQHLGDLSHPMAFDHFQKAIADLVRLFEVKIDFVGHDLHPGYMSTQAARQLAAQYRATLIPVQHHHAHAAAVMAEHDLHAPAMALVCDGTGYGLDDTIWGGELLVVDRGNCRRVGRLKPMRLPGGDSAARDPRRCGLALLHSIHGDGFADLPAAKRLLPADEERRFLAHMVVRGISSPWTSSTGRLFDAVAALLGVCSENAHEAQAAMALEAAAARGWDLCTSNGSGPELLSSPARAGVQWNSDVRLWELDPAELVRSLLAGLDEGQPVAGLAATFHRELARGLVALAEAARDAQKTELLVVSGGVFGNGHLCREVAQVAENTSFRTFFHKSYPPTDGGVAFGQAATVTQRLLTNMP